MTNVLQELIDILVGGLTSLGAGIGSGVNQFVQELFLKMGEDGKTVEGLSVFGGVVAIFAGIALAVGLTTLIFNWIKGMGGN